MGPFSENNINMNVETEISSIREDIKEIKSLLDVAKRPKVEAVLTIELRRYETKLSEMMDSLEKSKNQANQNTNSVTQPVSAKCYDVPYKSYSWDQSDKFVKFYLTNLKNVQNLQQPDGFQSSFHSKAVNFRVCNLSGKNHVFEIKELAHEIDPEKSTYKIKTDMVVIMLAKANIGKNWSHVTAAEKAKADKKNEVPKMDDDSDDDMKRTIAKAWTESQNKGPGAGLGAGG